MTELEWLKQQSGLSDDELKAMEAVAGHVKFVGMLQKLMGENKAALDAKDAAEKTRLDFEKRYQDEFVPEMRRVTQDAVRATGEAARMKAQLERAKEYGIVPDDNPNPNPNPAAPNPTDPPRAPGSPDPNLMTRDDFGRFSQQQSNVLITLNDLNAEHFKLFGSPLGNTQELVDEVQKQRTLGNRSYSLKQAWETKFDVAKKRGEIAAAERQKEIDTAVAAARKEDREKNGSEPRRPFRGSQQVFDVQAGGSVRRAMERLAFTATRKQALAYQCRRAKIGDYCRLGRVRKPVYRLRRQRNAEPVWSRFPEGTGDNAERAYRRVYLAELYVTPLPALISALRAPTIRLAAALRCSSRSSTLARRVERSIPART